MVLMSRKWKLNRVNIFYNYFSMTPLQTRRFFGGQNSSKKSWVQEQIC